GPAQIWPMFFLESPRNRAGILIVALGVAVLVALLPFLSGLFGAAVLYVIFVRPYLRLARTIKPGPAAALTLVAGLLIIALPLSWLIGIVVDQAPDALRTLQGSDVFGRI